MVGEWKGRGGWKRKEKKRGLGGKRDRERDSHLNGPQLSEGTICNSA